MASTLTPGAGDPVEVTVWRDGLTYDAAPTVYWPLDRDDPVVSAGPVRAPAATMTFAYTVPVWEALTSGAMIELDSDCPWKVPSRSFVVQRLTIQHAEDNPNTSRLIIAEVQTVALIP